ncbi:MAG: dehydratase [Methylococcales bacterium]|nr:dehydratase [Methylococcales bacterium]MBT7445919.1 dehydratase [Methylococcales bacterium]
MNNYLFKDIYVGLEHAFDATIDASMQEKFIAISNDTNPLHTDVSYAKSKGFDGTLVHGLLTSSFYSTLVGVYLPGKFCILQGIDISFSKPVYLNDHLHISGKVKYINEAYQQIEIKAIISNQDNVKISKATIKVGIMDE